jgi:PAS domain S-box-containing protein
LRNEQGEVAGIISVISDVTQRRRAEAALCASQQFNEQIIRSAREGIVVHARDLRYLEWNPFMEELRGVKREEVLGKDPLEVFPNLQATGFSDILKRALAGETVTTADFKFTKANGESGWTSVRYEPLQDRDGKITGILGIATDVTAWKNAEAALRESQQFNEEIIANAREGIVVYDRDFHFRLWNPFMEELTGLKSVEVVGKHPYEVFPYLRETPYLSRLQTALAGETITSSDFSLVSQRDGAQLWLSARYGPHRNSAGENVGVIVTVRDITLRRQAESLAAGQVKILKLIARGVAPDAVMQAIAQLIEEQQSAARAAIHLVDKAGGALRFVAAGPGLAPEQADFYRRLDSHDGLGPLGVVLAYGRPVVIADAQRHAAWVTVRSQMLAQGLHTVWVLPILGSNREVLGLVSLFYRAPHTPTETEKELLGTVLDLACIAIERREAETALNASEERYRLLFERNLAGVYRTTEDGQLLDCNQAFATIFGYQSTGELRLAGARSLYFDPATREQMLAELRARSRLNNYEMKLKRRDGSPIWTLANLALLPGEEAGAQIIEGVLLDISPHKRAEAKQA